MICLFIKGSIQDCIEAASQRNIPVSNLRLDTNRRTVRADVDSQYQKEVIQWYGEPSNYNLGQGYDPGTLLFYTL